MIEEQYHIVDETLPVTQNFELLKEEGLAFLQEFSGNSWTNFNPSDPGITILDQLCFALTELGYCIDFPMKDILTDKNDQLIVKNQFYTAEEILTTTPLTINDFRKYIIDGIEVVENAVIIPKAQGVHLESGLYHTYLLISETISDEMQIDQICEAAYYQFSRCRNLGELFLKPKPFQKLNYGLSGTFVVESEHSLDDLFKGAQDAINQYLFPRVTQYSYDDLISKGATPDSIFDGPKLQNGWILTESLGSKRNDLNTSEIIGILQEIKGISFVEEIAFTQDSKQLNALSSNDEQLIVVNLISSIQSGDIKVMWKGEQLTNAYLTNVLSRISTKEVANNPNKSVVNTDPKLPDGTYREIQEYYSIQNTFPEIFGVGENAIESGVADYQIARSRQLKGYLTLFDQVLANEFSQLASVHELFSFKNSICPAPFDQQALFAQMDQYELANPQYPAPFLSFSPSYFYQSLYEVPNIRPILKNSGAFDFSLQTTTSQQLEIDSWKAYKNDPYNTYIKGVGGAIEESQEGLERRNEILDHLIARHGESPYLIDEIISTSSFSANKLEDKVIFKSLYVQNIGLLSYYRFKAYNFMGCRKIEETLPLVTEKMWIELYEEQQNEFILRSQLIDETEKLSEQDFDDYSSVELKLNLLFGLRSTYRNFIIDNYYEDSLKDEVSQTYWMMIERKGSIFIESDLLLQSADFQIVIIEKNDEDQVWQIGEIHDYETALEICYELEKMADSLLEKLNDAKTLTTADGSHAKKTRVNWESSYFEDLGDSGVKLGIKASWGGDAEVSTNHPIFKNKLHFIFPDYVFRFSKDSFKTVLEDFVADTISPRINCSFYRATTHRLEKLIPHFADWHNNLRFQGPNKNYDEDLVKSTGKLVLQMIKLYLENLEENNG
ncbi:MAG: hypothetical protein MI810_07360 [Flavobacteriales bacterium]|nr:hypothetical protein [Flavobacteriales bacterium]